MTRRTGPTPATRALVWDRDLGSCARCGHTIRDTWSLHHRIPRGAGGSHRPDMNSPANLVLLCDYAMSNCHHHVESHRYQARLDGYLISQHISVDPADVPLLYQHTAWVRLDHHGGLTVAARTDTQMEGIL